MSPAELFAHPWSQAVTLALVHFVWQGLLIAGLLAAVVQLFRIRRPQARYACSLAALLLMAACPVGTVVWQLAEGRVQGSEFGVQETEDSGQRTENIATAHSALSTAQPYLLTGWLVGVGFFGCRLLCGLVGLRQLRRDSLPLTGELADRVDRLGRRLGMRARKLVQLSCRVTEAMAVGLLRPIVLIPASWATEMPPDMLEAVIAHELAHLRRQDLWINLLQRVVETLLFYHPAVWWLSRRLRAERELCCDELAVAVTGRRLEYVQALEHVARRQGARVEPALAAGIRGERNMRLLERVRNVLGLSAASERSLWPAGLLALLLPLGAWAYTSGLISGDATVVVANDDDKDDDKDAKEDKEDGNKEDGAKEDGDNEEREEKEVRKDGDREKERDGDERAEEEREIRKEGDKERDNPEAAERKRERIEDLKFFGKEGEARRDSDKKPVKEGARDGDKKPVKEGARDGDRPAKEGARDGDKKPVKEGERRVIRKDGELLEIEIAGKEGSVRRVIRKDGDREEVVIEEVRGKEPGKDMDARMNELLSMVKRLSMENERLKAELAEIRGTKEREGFYRVREGEAAAKEAAAKEREAAIREKEGVSKERAAALREKDAAAKRAVAEKEEAIARERKEGAARKEAEIRERKIKEGALKEGLQDREREIERKKAIVREAEEEQERLIERKKAAAAEREKEDKEEKGEDK